MESSIPETLTRRLLPERVQDVPLIPFKPGGVTFPPNPDQTSLVPIEALHKVQPEVYGPVCLASKAKLKGT